MLVDYFVADEAVISRVDLSRKGPGGCGLPYVDCKGWLAGVGSLAAELTARDRKEFGEDEAVDEWDDGGLSRVPAKTVAALANIDDARLGEHAEDEILDEDELQRNRDLVALARLALGANRNLYCWWSL